MSKAQKVEPFAHLEIAPVLRKQRLFEAGQMKLLALHLISFAPKYGYDLIKVVGSDYRAHCETTTTSLNFACKCTRTANSLLNRLWHN